MKTTLLALALCFALSACTKGQAFDFVIEENKLDSEVTVNIPNTNDEWHIMVYSSAPVELKATWGTSSKAFIRGNNTGFYELALTPTDPRGPVKLTAHRMDDKTTFPVTLEGQITVEQADRLFVQIYHPPSVFGKDPIPVSIAVSRGGAPINGAEVQLTATSGRTSSAMNIPQTPNPGVYGMTLGGLSRGDYILTFKVRYGGELHTTETTLTIQDRPLVRITPPRTINGVEANNTKQLTFTAENLNEGEYAFALHYTTATGEPVTTVQRVQGPGTKAVTFELPAGASVQELWCNTPDDQAIKLQ